MQATIRQNISNQEEDNKHLVSEPFQYRVRFGDQIYFTTYDLTDAIQMCTLKEGSRVEMVNPLLLTEKTSDTKQQIQPPQGQTASKALTSAIDVSHITDNYEWKMIPIWVKQDQATEFGDEKIDAGPDGGSGGRRKKLAAAFNNIEDIKKQDLMQPLDFDGMRHKHISEIMPQKAVNDVSFNDNIYQQINQTQKRQQLAAAAAVKEQFIRVAHTPLEMVKASDSENSPQLNQNITNFQQDAPNSMGLTVEAALDRSNKNRKCTHGGATCNHPVKIEMQEVMAEKEREDQWMLTKEQIKWVKVKLAKDIQKVKEAQRQRKANFRRQNRKPDEESETETEQDLSDDLNQGYEDLTVDQVIQSLQRSYVVKQASGRMQQRLECLVCQKVYPMLYSAVSHVRNHFKCKPFKCTSCHETITQMNIGFLHMKTAICTRRQQKYDETEGQKRGKALRGIGKKLSDNDVNL